MYIWVKTIIYSTYRKKGHMCMYVFIQLGFYSDGNCVFYKVITLTFFNPYVNIRNY